MTSKVDMIAAMVGLVDMAKVHETQVQLMKLRATRVSPWSKDEIDELYEALVAEGRTTTIPTFEYAIARLSEFCSEALHGDNLTKWERYVVR